MVKLLGISGSLRRASYNSSLLRAATRLMPPDAQLEVASIRDIPLYDGDVEAQGIPPAVAQLKDAVAAAACSTAPADGTRNIPSRGPGTSNTVPARESQRIDTEDLGRPLTRNRNRQWAG